jgi:excisionase family DNA binding protein
MKSETKRLAYSVPEMAVALGISRTVAYDLITTGTSPSVRLGKRKILVPAERLRQWNADNTAEKASEVPVVAGQLK